MSLFDIAREEVSELSAELQSITQDVGSSSDGFEANRIVGGLRELWEGFVYPNNQGSQGINSPWLTHLVMSYHWIHATSFACSRTICEEEPQFVLLLHIILHSLASFSRARQQVSRDAPTLNFVDIDIGQGNPDKGTALPRAAAELLSAVAHHVAPILPFKSLADSDATVQEAFDANGRHRWLQLACHGMPNRENHSTPRLQCILRRVSDDHGHPPTSPGVYIFMGLPHYYGPCLKL